MTLLVKLDAILLLLATVTWQLRVATSNSGCVSDWCFCFPDGEIECGDAYLSRVPRFRQASDAQNPQNVTVFNYIDLSRNRIRRIGARSFRNIRVRMIKIWENQVGLSIDGRAFAGLEDTLQVISIKMNKFSELPAGLFKDMRKLNKIELAENRISKIQQGVFRGAKNVETLNLEDNRLGSLAERIFSGLVNLKTSLLGFMSRGTLLLGNELVNLKTLQLAHNRLRFIDTEALSALSKLETLDLRSNKLRDLQPGGFGRLKSLRRLDLSYNRLPALFPQMFQGMRNLQSLVLYRNAITFVARGSFTGMSNLQELIIGKNKLTHIKPGAFDGLVSLRILSLNDNNIADLPDAVFGGLKSLTKVQLENNELQTANACAFENASAVDELLLTGNPLHCDCAVAWTSVPGKSGRANVHGKCKTPVMVSGQDISLGDKYHVCTRSDSEPCKSRSAKNNSAKSANRFNDVIQPDAGLRYKRYG